MFSFAFSAVKPTKVSPISPGHGAADNSAVIKADGLPLWFSANVKRQPFLLISIREDFIMINHLYSITLCTMLGGLLMAAVGVGQSPAQAQTTTGTIAYVRAGGTSGDEIRLIEPDSGQDRALWRVPVADPGNILTILSLDWRPDGRELAFSSNHERTCSIHDSDLYSIQPDGGNFRRVSNGPNCDRLADYPNGQVRVTVRNFTSKFDTNFYVHVQGAPGVMGVTIPSNGIATVTLPDVADFGAVNQPVAVLHTGDSRDQFDDYRWYVGEVDVQHGQTVTASPNPASVTGDGAPHPGAWGPTWRSDGSRIGYAGSGAGCFNVHSVPADNTPLGATGEQVLIADEISPCSMAWGPTAAVADQVIFVAFPNLGRDGATFYRTTEGANASSGAKLFSLGPTVMLLWYDWLPDGEGFLFVRTTKFVNTSFVESNLFEYRFDSGTTTQLSHLSDEFVRSFSVAPDGQSIVFERAATLASADSDLWIMNRNGSELRLLVKDGRIPNWNPQGSQAPTSTPITPTVLPSATPMPDTTPTPETPAPLRIYLPAIQR
jgi:hypothetical protein